MYKFIILICSVTFLASFFPKEDSKKSTQIGDRHASDQTYRGQGEEADPLEQWKREQEEKSQSHDIENDHRKSEKQNSEEIPWIGPVAFHSFGTCSLEYTKIIGSQIPDKNGQTQPSCIEGDFNNDTKQDFLALIKNSEFCEGSFCPLYLYIKTSNENYKQYVGPQIRGNKIGFINRKDDDGIKDLFYYSPFMESCVWKWNKKSELNCIIGSTPIQHDTKK